MAKVIRYDSIEEKSVIESSMVRRLTPEESLIHCLDVMDFMASFRNKNIPRESDNIEWIILEKKKK